MIPYESRPTNRRIWLIRLASLHSRASGPRTCGKVTITPTLPGGRLTPDLLECVGNDIGGDVGDDGEQHLVETTMATLLLLTLALMLEGRDINDDARGFIASGAQEA